MDDNQFDRDLTLRRMARHEIDQIWTIDRGEIIETIYRWENGQLVRVPDYFDVRGWKPSTIEHSMPEFYEIFDRGGEFWGAWDGAHVCLRYAVRAYYPFLPAPRLCRDARAGPGTLCVGAGGYPLRVGAVKGAALQRGEPPRTQSPEERIQKA